MYGTPPPPSWPLSAETDADGSRWLRCGERFDVLAGARAGRPVGAAPADRLRPARAASGPVGWAEPDGSRPAAYLFFVAPGAKEDLPELLEWLDWGGIDLELSAYGEGERVPEPTRWPHDPNCPAPEVVALLATIAECCSRRLLRQAVPGPRRDGGESRTAGEPRGEIV